MGDDDSGDLDRLVFTRSSTYIRDISQSFGSLTWF